MHEKRAYLVPAFALSLLLAGVSSAYAFGPISPEDIVTKHEAMFTHQAEILGISQEELKNAWSQGKSLPDIAKEQGISKEELQKKMKESRKAKMRDELKILVENGVITQEQADSRLSHMDDILKNAKRMGHFGKLPHQNAF